MSFSEKIRIVRLRHLKIPDKQKGFKKFFDVIKWETSKETEGKINEYYDLGNRKM